MTINKTTHLSRISIDTGLSITEAEQAIRENLIAFDYATSRYYEIVESHNRQSIYHKCK